MRTTGNGRRQLYWILARLVHCRLADPRRRRLTSRKRADRRGSCTGSRTRAPSVRGMSWQTTVPGSLSSRRDGSTHRSRAAADERHGSGGPSCAKDHRCAADDMVREEAHAVVTHQRCGVRQGSRSLAGGSSLRLVGGSRPSSSWSSSVRTPVGELVTALSGIDESGLT
jgi:hypothetical protein